MSPAFEVGALHELLASNLPTFLRSTHVDVSERANLVMNLSNFFKACHKMNSLSSTAKLQILGY